MADRRIPRRRGPLARLPRRLDPPDSVVSPDTQDAGSETDLTQEPVSVAPDHYTRRELVRAFAAAAAGVTAAGFVAYKIADEPSYVTQRWVQPGDEEFVLNREAITAWAQAADSRFAPHTVRAVFVQGNEVTAVQLILRPITRGADGQARTVTRSVSGLPPWPVDNWPA